MDKKFVHVENLCISVCKTLCILHAKLCAFFTSIVTICVFLMFPTKFSHLSHRLFHSHTTPVNKQSFPLFHIPYYYYYNLFININNNYRKEIL